MMPAGYALTTQLIAQLVQKVTSDSITIPV